MDGIVCLLVRQMSNLMVCNMRHRLQMLVALKLIYFVLVMLTIEIWKPSGFWQLCVKLVTEHTWTRSQTTGMVPRFLLIM